MPLDIEEGPLLPSMHRLHFNGLLEDCSPFLRLVTSHAGAVHFQSLRSKAAVGKRSAWVAP